MLKVSWDMSQDMSWDKICLKTCFMVSWDMSQDMSWDNISYFELEQQRLETLSWDIFFQECIFIVSNEVFYQNVMDIHCLSEIKTLSIKKNSNMLSIQVNFYFFIYCLKTCLETCLKTYFQNLHKLI